MKSGPKPTLENAFARFETRYIPEPNTGCWLWNGKTINSGYCQFGFLGGRDLAHRASWIMHNGPIPNNLWVLHKCDIKTCVNPEHLFLGTNSINQLDAIAKGVKIGLFYSHEKRRLLTHCVHGHEFTQENTRVDINGSRHCRKCHANQEREKRHAARAYVQSI